MLDKKTQLLLKTINKQIRDDSYKVIEITEFLNKFKKNQKVNENTLQNMMNFLQKRDFIDIKYSDPQVYCLAVKQKARTNQESELIESRQFKKMKKIFFFYVILAGISAFLGAWAAIYLFLRS